MKKTEIMLRRRGDRMLLAKGKVIEERIKLFGGNLTWLLSDNLSEHQHGRGPETLAGWQPIVRK